MNNASLTSKRLGVATASTTLAVLLVACGSNGATTDSQTHTSAPHATAASSTESPSTTATATSPAETVSSTTPDNLPSGEDTETSAQSSTITQNALNPAAVDAWHRHGSMLILNPDGTGRLTLADGAATQSDYAVSWTGAGPESTVTVEEQTGSLGSPSASETAQIGQTFTVSVDGNIMTITGLNSRPFTMCRENSPEHYGGTCGA